MYQQKTDGNDLYYDHDKEGEKINTLIKLSSKNTGKNTPETETDRKIEVAMFQIVDSVKNDDGTLEAEEKEM